MGTYCQTYGDTLPIQNTCTSYMGTDCQYEICVQHIWGQIANTKEYIWNIIDYHAWHESRSTLHFRQQPRQSFFNRDMFLNIHLIADWQIITQRREHLIHEKLMRENQIRRGYNYAPQQMILKKKWKPKKLDKRTSGPHKIVQVHVNGTVTIQLRPGLTERFNTRQIIPYKQ
jgi:hypothetical protein